MTEIRLSEALGVPPSENWTHVSRAGVLVRLERESVTTIEFNGRDGRKMMLPVSLFAELFAPLPAGGCLALGTSDEGYACDLCGSFWQVGKGLPACAFNLGED